MIEAFFINLDRSTARRAYMEQMAHDAGVRLQRISAVDGRLLSDCDYDRVHPERLNTRRMTKSEVSCFLSHRKAWEKIVDMGVEYGAVFEDDILFGTAVRDVLSDSSWIRSDVDLIKLDKFTNSSVEFGEAIDVGNGLIAKRMMSIHVGCGGYIISKDFAERILQETQSFFVPVDHFLYDPNEMDYTSYRIWQLLPAVCIHQHVSRINFLPSSAELSSLQKHRKETIKTYRQRKGKIDFLVTKFIKELKRPFSKFGQFCYMKCATRLRGTTWERIRFQKNSLCPTK